MCGRAHLLHACLIKLICVLVSALSCMHAHELARLPARVLSDSRARVILQRYAFALISHNLTLGPHPRLRMHTARASAHCTLPADLHTQHARCTQLCARSGCLHWLTLYSRDHQEWAHPSHICTGTGRGPTTLPRSLGAAWMGKARIEDLKVRQEAQQVRNAV